MNKCSTEGNKSLNNLKHTLKIMRITLFLLFLSILCSQAATGYSQGVELSLDSRSASIKEICKEIERKSDFRFVFTGNAKRLFKKKVDIGLDSRNIEEILDAMLADTDFSYSIIENQVVIYHDHTKVTAKNAKEMIPELTVQQQKKTITGTVVDANGEPIIGANIIESGTTNGTITDANGKFSLKVEDKATIRVSYIGYIDQNINTSEKVSFDITLLEDVELLDEIVVVGYGTMKKSDLTGAIKSISMENLPPSVNTNIVQSLRGLVAGLNVSGGNRAGEVPSMTIRGQNTLSASSTPLIVLDGIIFNGNFSDINPTDVERIDILKDASSSAIYGSRSANGVVHVTTKKGKTEKPKVNFEVSYGIQDYTNNPVKWMNAEQYAHRLVDYNYFQKLYTWYKKSPKSPTDLGGKPVHPGYSDDVVMSVLKSEDERKKLEGWK
ncbi:MAG: carboxypeptidase-like regulatory domain-containing protein [Fermentimonas sp.]